MNDLGLKVQQDIGDILQQQKKFFFNEKDLQVHLARELEKCQWTVHLEYHIPIIEEKDKNGHVERRCLCKSNIEYPWSEKAIYIDLVVEENNLFVPIELKYKTCSINNEAKVHRFGEDLETGDIIKNQSAQDIGRYAFWKDVKRLELLNKRFKNVVGGIAVFVTNDKSYTNLPKSNQKTKVGYYDFRMFAEKDNVISGKLSWRKNGERIDENIPAELCNFSLEGEYVLPQWKDYDTLPQGDFGQNTMYYMILPVNKGVAEHEKNE